ncbi:hypothetical protein BRADI_2g09566v3 [Brachypodium distachyon]|uniref:Uncharacterized protein n=1 Tax=Brachypodium distachyon TaxID=15368 RepID=A0A0Q3ICX6_BRADI|nr:hypothetical protein BRADI_2g09566v3 [Brachypodium distachyon]
MAALLRGEQRAAAAWPRGGGAAVVSGAGQRVRRGGAGQRAHGDWRGEGRIGAGQWATAACPCHRGEDAKPTKSRRWHGGRRRPPPPPVPAFRAARKPALCLPSRPRSRFLLPLPFSRSLSPVPSLTAPPLLPSSNSSGARRLEDLQRRRRIHRPRPRRGSGTEATGSGLSSPPARVLLPRAPAAAAAEDHGAVVLGGLAPAPPTLPAVGSGAPDVKQCHIS